MNEDDNNLLGSLIGDLPVPAYVLNGAGYYRQRLKGNPIVFYGKKDLIGAREEIRQVRYYNGFSGADVAEKMGYSEPSQYYRIEREPKKGSKDTGRNITPHDAERLTGIMDVRPLRLSHPDISESDSFDYPRKSVYYEADGSLCDGVKRVELSIDDLAALSRQTAPGYVLSAFAFGGPYSMWHVVRPDEKAPVFFDLKPGYVEERARSSPVTVLFTRRQWVLHSMICDGRSPRSLSAVLSSYDAIDALNFDSHIAAGMRRSLAKVEREKEKERLRGDS